MENSWLSKAKRLQALAATGRHFANNEFDRERYEEIDQLAIAMIAELGDVPIEKVRGLVSDASTGYATPKVDVRGALIEDGKILLVQEKSDGLWTLPGGFADVGLSASENVTKEMREEAGLSVTATHLYCLRHKAKRRYTADVRDFYKLFFICEQSRRQSPSPGLETMQAAFFPPDNLPPLSRGRTIEADIEGAFAFCASAVPSTVFD